MNVTRAHQRPLHFEWWRFAILAALILGTIGSVTWYKSGSKTPFGVIAAMAIFATSLVGFFALRWHKLRVAAATGSLAPRDFYADPRTHILGPKAPRIIWFACTMVALIVTIMCFALRGG